MEKYLIVIEMIVQPRDSGQQKQCHGIFILPLFWRIDSIIKNGLSTKKDVKSSMAELDQLLDRYGEDARLFRSSH